ncbi:MAG: methylcobamide--CoM methyltransferase [Deltaproteobacteria bacterium]|jgi:[methyl-Co(III) methanol-specific corrinoid protein]:coenzyme M methyltransferase|nr:methylcobamide--CoM methyltransferase [Deltaproteobacteria bacterium]
MMTEKERLAAVFKGGTPDRPPCICPGGMMNMITTELMEKAGTLWPMAHTKAKLMADLAAASYDLRCFENYGLPFCMTVEVEAMGAEVDLGSLEREPHVVKYAIDSAEQWPQLRPLDFSRGRVRVVLDAIKLLKARNDAVPIIGNLTGPVSAASSLMEPTVYYKQLRRNKGPAKELTDFVTEELLKFGLEQIEAGVDFIAISDPSASGEILGPALFDEFARPALTRIIEGLKERRPDLGVILHICGKMRTVFKSLSQVPAEVLSFDAVVSLAKAKESFPGRLIMGNVSTFALELSTPEKVAALTRHCLKWADVVSPACGMGVGSPLKNVQSILDAVKSGEAGKAPEAE